MPESNVAPPKSPEALRLIEVRRELRNLIEDLPDNAPASVLEDIPAKIQRLKAEEAKLVNLVRTQAPALVVDRSQQTDEDVRRARNGWSTPTGKLPANIHE